MTCDELALKAEEVDEGTRGASPFVRAIIELLGPLVPTALWHVK